LLSDEWFDDSEAHSNMVDGAGSTRYAYNSVGLLTLEDGHGTMTL